MNKLIGRFIKYSNVSVIKSSKLTLEEVHKIVLTKDKKQKSCINCRFSVLGLQSWKETSWYELKCRKFSYEKNGVVIYPNILDCRNDSSKCGIEGKYYESEIPTGQPSYSGQPN